MLAVSTMTTVIHLGLTTSLKLGSPLLLVCMRMSCTVCSLAYAPHFLVWTFCSRTCNTYIALVAMKWHLRLLQGRERPLVAGHPQQAVAKALFGSTHSCTDQEHQQRLNAGSEQLQDS
jgi:hypothetical protein